MTTQRKSAHQRGLGVPHRRTRQRLLNALADGTPCWWCDLPMYRDPARNYDQAALEADHSNARSIHGTTSNRADRLLHRRCNRQRFDGLADHQRPAVTGTDPRAPFRRAPADTPTRHDTRLLSWPW